MRHRMFPALAATAVIACAALFMAPALAQEPVAAAPESDAHPAAQHMEKLGGEVLAVLSDGSLSQDQRIAFLRKLLARDLDIPLIARFVAGRHWRKAAPAERSAYLEAFRAFVVGTFSARLGGVAVDRFEVLGARDIGKKDILVRCRVRQTDSKPLDTDWRVRQKGDSFRILDLSVEGISMALTLRKEFASVLRRKGSVGALVPILKEKAI